MKSSTLTAIRLTCFASVLIAFCWIIFLVVFGAFMTNNELKEAAQFPLRLLILSVVLYGLHYILDRFQIKFKGN